MKPGRTKCRVGGATLAVLVILLLGVPTASLAFYREFLERGVSYAHSDTIAIGHTSAPPIGANTFLHLEADAENIRRELAILRSAGVGIIRQQFLWEEIEPQEGIFSNSSSGLSTWSKYDTIVKAARDQGIEVMARLERSPRWATPGWEPTIPASQKPPKDLKLFGSFVHSVVSRYKGEVRFFQIWNEPNLWGEWGESDPDAAEYVEMLKIAYLSAKSANPQAVVIAAGLAPTTERGPNNVSDVLYLQRMYFLGAKDYFDVMSSMSYGLMTGPNDIRLGEAWSNFPRAVLLRDVMKTFGDDAKPIWASEYGWMSLPDEWRGRASIWGNHSVDDQAAWTVEGLLRARREWPWMPTMFIWASRWPHVSDPDDPTFWFRLMDPDFTARPALIALRELAAEGTIAGVGLHQEDHSAFKYAGPWPREPSDEAVTGFWSTTGIPGATAEFQFEGDNVKLVTRRGPDMGMMRIRIDGQDPLADLVPKNNFGQSVLDLYSKEVEPVSKIALASRLSPGSHVLTLESLGRSSPYSTGEKVVIDGVEISNNRPLWPYLAFGIAWAMGLGIVAWRFVHPTWDRLAPAIHRLSLLPPTGSQQTLCGISLPALLVSSVATLLMAVLPGGSLDSPITLLRLFILLYLVGVATAHPDALAIVAVATQFLTPIRPETGPIAISIPELLLITLALGWLIRGIYRRQFEFRGSTMGLIAAYFLIAALASTSFAAYPKFAVRSFRTTIAEPIALFFLLTAFLPGKRAAALIPAIAVGGTIAAATAIFDPLMDRVVTTGIPRFRGMYDSPNNLAFALERTVPLLIGLTLAWKGSTLGRLVAAAATMTGLVLGVTFSRGAWIASAIPPALLALRQWGRLITFPRMLALIAIAIPLGVLVGFMSAEHLSTLLRTDDRSAISRIWLWDSSAAMIRDFPLFGIGPDNFLYQYATYLRPEAWREPYISHPHNFLLDAWLSTGVFGMLTLITAVLLFFFSISRSYNSTVDQASSPILLSAAASMTIALAHGLVDNFYFRPELASFFWTLMAFAVLAKNNIGDKGLSSSTLSQLGRRAPTQ